VALSRRPKGEMTRYRRYWDTVGLDLLWNRASKTVSHEGTDPELDALANRKLVKGVSEERRDMRELCDAPHRCLLIDNKGLVHYQMLSCILLIKMMFYIVC